MDKNKIKKITIYSLIVGGILGLAALIPFIQFIAIVIMSTLSSFFIIFYMERKREIGQLTMKGAGILGAYIGFISLIGFLVIFLPLAAIFGAIFSAVSSDNMYFTLIKFLIQIWWILLLMGGLITALFNSFTLISYIYIKDTYIMIEGKKEVKGNFTPRDRNGI